VKEEIRSELLLADHRGAWIASFYESRSPKHFPNKGGRLKADSFSRGFQARCHRGTATDVAGCPFRSTKKGLWFAKTLADFEINDLAPPAPVLL
jgi:hypothetical protein